MNFASKLPKAYGPRTEQYPLEQSAVCIKNMAARIISTNVVDELTGDPQAFQFLPGNHEMTRVPAHVLDSNFVQSLINTGDLHVFPLEG